MLTEPQGLAVAKFLMACVPGDEHELGHGQMPLWRTSANLALFQFHKS